MKKMVKSALLKPLRLAVLTASLLALVSCETVRTTQGGVVGVNREQRMAISAQTIEDASNKEYAQVIAEARQKGLLNRNPAYVSRVRAIADRLIQQTPAFRPDALH